MMSTRPAAMSPIRLLSVGLALSIASGAAAQDAPPPATAEPSAAAEPTPAPPAEAEPTAEAEPPAPAEPTAEAEPVPEPAAPVEPVDPATLEVEAKDAMRAGDCETAAAKFDAFADAIEADAERMQEQLTARFLSGVCYERLDKLEEAADAFRAVVYGDAPEALVEKARPRLEGIEPLLPVTVSFVCEEEGVTITFAALPDQAKSCDETWQLPSGNYRGAASASDGREVPLVVTITPGVPEEVVVLLPAASGSTRNTIAEATAPPPPVNESRTAEWLLTSGAAVSLGAGLAFNLIARSAVDDGDDAYGRYERARAVYDVAGAAAARTEVEAARDDADSAAITSYVFLGIGAGLAGAAVWMWLDEPAIQTEAEARAVRLVPTLDGIGLVGRW